MADRLELQFERSGKFLFPPVQFVYQQRANCSGLVGPSARKKKKKKTSLKLLPSGNRARNHSLDSRRLVLLFWARPMSGRSFPLFFFVVFVSPFFVLLSVDSAAACYGPV